MYSCVSCLESASCPSNKSLRSVCVCVSVCLSVCTCLCLCLCRLSVCCFVCVCDGRKRACAPCIRPFIRPLTRQLPRAGGSLGADTRGAARIHQGCVCRLAKASASAANYPLSTHTRAHPQMRFFSLQKATQGTRNECTGPHSQPFPLLFSYT